MIRCLKHRYESHEQAAAGRRKLYRANQRNKSRRGALNVWYCGRCEAWHIGHERGREIAVNREVAG